MYCTKCGKKIVAGGRFCPYCGEQTRLAPAPDNTPALSPLEEEQPEPTATQAPSGNPEAKSPVAPLGQVSAFLQVKWQLVAVGCASLSALVYLIIVTGYASYWENTVCLLVALVTAGLVFFYAKKQALIVAAPFALLLLIRLINLISYPYVLGAVYFVCMLGVLVIFILAVLDKFPSKELAFILILVCVGFYFLLSVINIRWIWGFWFMLAPIALMATFCAITWAMVYTEDVATFRGFGAASLSAPAQNPITPTQQQAPDMSISVPAQQNQQGEAVSSSQSLENVSTETSATVPGTMTPETRKCWINIAIGAGIFIVCWIIQAFYDSSMFSLTYYIPIGDTELFHAALVNVAFWGGWIAAVRFVGSGVLGLFSSHI